MWKMRGGRYGAFVFFSLVVWEVLHPCPHLSSRALLDLQFSRCTSPLHVLWEM